jgi:hypothetical protein
MKIWDRPPSSKNMIRIFNYLVKIISNFSNGVVKQK